MKLTFSIDGTMAMHFAPDMMLSGMRLSGASIIWLRIVFALWMRSMSASRADDPAHAAVVRNVSKAIAVCFFQFMVQNSDLDRGASGQLTPAEAILVGFNAKFAALMMGAGYSLVT